ncbi:MAG: hypothetical protein EHM43_09420 [Ignavibacteriae bacterium]|jgi:quinol monooxygenase YgiN|nr:MAG: hypothetical protein EHM43_09420 [Ignavibacteriota bacterium]
MPRVQFRISYTIPDGKRAEYLGLVEKLRAHYATGEAEYAVYEDQGQHNRFQEVFVYPSQEAYDASDDPELTKNVADVIDAVYALARDVQYSVGTELA